MNILTFDIEEWFIKKAYFGGRPERYATFDRCLDEILDLLDERQLQATFFVVGMMAKDFPEVVKLIHRRGHEIGCHSNVHMWVNKMSQDEMREDTRLAIDNLEQCIGCKVKSYRAPSFSVGKSNEWAFDVLAQCGIENDSSVIPASMELGGFPDFEHQCPTLIETPSGTIKEYPIALAHLGGRNVAFSGGGYFRLFPLWFVRWQMSRNDYNICYFHIDDLVPSNKKMMSREEFENYYKEPATVFNRCKRRWKSNIGKGTAFDRMRRLIRSHDFISITQAQEQIDWSKCPVMH